MSRTAAEHVSAPSCLSVVRRASGRLRAHPVEGLDEEVGAQVRVVDRIAGVDCGEGHFLDLGVMSPAERDGSYGVRQREMVAVEADLPFGAVAAGPDAPVDRERPGTGP